MRSPRGPVQRRDRGAALIELALVLPLLLLLAFGTTEVALAWTAENRVQGAVSHAARVAASSGAQREADRDILYALQASLSDDALDNLDRVVIFRSSGSNGEVPTSCIKPPGSTSETGVDGTCNTYTGATVKNLRPSNEAASFSGPCSSPRKDWRWCPTDRQDSLAASGGPHWIGVWVRTTHPNPVPFFFDDFGA